MNTSIQPRRSTTSRDLYIVVALTAAAFLSRFYGLWQWDLVGDENFTAMHAYERFKSFVNPAYYTLVVVFFELFGEDLWISRIPAFLLSGVSVGALYLYWSRVVGRSAALIAAFLLVLSAWHLWYSQFARHYMGVFLFGSIAYYYFLSAVLNNQLKHLTLALCFSLAGILFHATAIFVPASCAAAYLALWVLHGKNTQVATRIIKIYLSICAAAGLVALPFAYIVLTRWVGGGETWGYGAIAIIPQFLKYVQIPLVVAALFGWLLMVIKMPVYATFFAVAIGVPILFLVAATPFMAISPAYAYYTLPLIVVIAGVACEEIRQSLAGELRLFAVFPIALLVVALLPSFASHYLDRSSLNFGEAVTFVEENYADEDGILSFVPGFKNKTGMPYNRVPFISFERDSSINWYAELDPLLTAEGDTWIIISSKRRPLAPQLENWLFCNSRLVWQQHAVRIDYEVNGYQIFQVQPPSPADTGLNRCAMR